MWRQVSNMRLFAVVSYDGTSYHGWQKQVGDKSVQEEIEKVLSQILNTEINIYGSGRTDAGVHAFNQTFHFDVDKEVDIARLRYSANMLLPSSIFIKSLEKVNDDFHARFSTKGKVYRYSLYFKERDPFLSNRSCFYPYEFDEELFKKALDKFKGEHNFQDFTSKEEDNDNFVRRIDDIVISKNEKELLIDISGNGFMRYMIRDIIGSALAVASKKEPLEFIDNHLDSKIRNIVSYKSEACGLYLLKVIY